MSESTPTPGSSDETTGALTDLPAEGSTFEPEEDAAAATAPDAGTADATEDEAAEDLERSNPT